MITAAEVTKAGISRGSLKHLVDSGVLEHASRGVYQLAEVWDDKMYQLQIRYKKGIFSGETALSLSDLTDRTPIRFQMTFPLKYNIGVLKKKNVKCNRTKPEWHEMGVIQLKTPAGNLVNVYCMEKTLCDILRTQNDVDIQVVSAAFKRYAKRLDKSNGLELIWRCYYEKQAEEKFNESPMCAGIKRATHTAKRCFGKNYRQTHCGI